jgi:BirA family transcriptional regulator, biotin operon repressor / biotin---[acetyl-CoA-carboxylase] ligase
VKDAAYAVLEALASSPSDFVSAEAVAEASGVSPKDIDEHVDQLNRLGLPTDTHPVYGFRLPIPFDLIDAKSVTDTLNSRGVPWAVNGCLETGSSNDLVASAALSGAPDGTTFFAEHQTKGRGRLGRSWHSPVGSGLWFSVLRRHDLPIDEAWRITLGAGLAVAKAIEKLTPIKPQLKWPNDVQIDGRKVAGILTESRPEGDRLRQSVIGIGVNVHLERDEFPPELRETACSVGSEGGRIGRGDLLVEILHGLATTLELASADLRGEWSDRCSHWGQAVRVERDGRLIEGRAVTLADDGAFIVEADDGSRFSVHAGEVTHLRMAN